MVCDGPDPPETDPQELTPPARHELLMNGNTAGEDSDEEQNEYFGYEPLAQGPEAVTMDDDNSENELEDDPTHEQQTPIVLPIEPMENILTREVWCAPRSEDPIQMDSVKAEQVMTAMANFALPSTSIPEWAQCVSEDQWKHTLHDKINMLKNN